MDDSGAADVNRWRLMERLAGELDHWAGSYGWFAEKAAQVVAEEIGDGATVILLDLPGERGPVARVHHPDPIAHATAKAFLESFTPEDLTYWVQLVASRVNRTRGTLSADFAEDSVLLGRLDGYRRETGIADLAYAPLRHHGRVVRGILLCRRDPGSAPLADFDHAALATAADTISLGLELAAARTEQRRVANQAQVFAALAQSSPDFIGIATTDGHVTFVNDAGRALIRMPEDVDVTATHMRDYYTGNARPIDQPVGEWPQAQQSMWEGLSTLRDWTDNSEITVSVRTFSVKDSAGIPVAIATVQRDVRHVLETGKALAKLAEQRRRLLTEVVNAEQAERERIAQEVHDDAIQMLAAAQLRMQLLLSKVDDGASTRNTAELVIDLLSNAQRSLRQLLLDLEPADGPTRSIDDALRQAAETFFCDTPIAVTVAGQLTDLPAEVASVFYRAGREAVSNARRHAHAQHVTVTLSEDDSAWRLSVIDDGVGIPQPLPVLAGHRGVRGMISRVEALGGICAISPGSNGGTRVLISIPRIARR